MLNRSYLSSINEVAKELINAGIPFVFRTKQESHGAELVFVWAITHRPWASVTVDDTTHGKLTVFGTELLTEQEKTVDDKCGYLSAEEAVNRIILAWERNKAHE